MSTLPRWLDTSNEFVARRDGSGLYLVTINGRDVSFTREQLIRLGLWSLVAAGVTEPADVNKLVDQVKR